MNTYTVGGAQHHLDAMAPEKAARLRATMEKYFLEAEVTRRSLLAFRTTRKTATSSLQP
jgi:hypothetical protein